MVASSRVWLDCLRGFGWVALAALVLLACSAPADGDLAAAREAVAKGAHDEAIALLQELIPKSDAVPERGQARELLGDCHIAKEQWHEAGWGATVISQLAQAGVAFDAPPTRVSLPDDLLVPYSPPLEDAFIPSAEAVTDAARRTLVT